MKQFIKTLLFFLLLSTAFSCQDPDDIDAPVHLRISDFVWKGMNLYYLWQSDVTNLDDHRFTDQNQLNAFLSEYSNPVDLFNSLRTDPAVDRFSVIYSDYRILEGVLTGNTKNNGMNFGLRYKNGSATDIFGWVRYVLPNSDAAMKNVQRGIIFYGINGTPLTIDNYRALLNNDTYTLQLADYDNGNITPNGQTITLTKTAIAENPILINNTIQQGNHRIGYLMYNGFYSGYDNQLNDAFGQLKAQNITHLVLDLRYNSGGSIRTATRLASMITGQYTGQLFAKEQWNTKAQSFYETTSPGRLNNNFVNAINNTAINSLNLSKIYILTSKSTASASELIINCLKPYVQVVQIGDITTGKNVGSVTLYDSPSYSKKNVNRSHYYAMQPIVLKTINKNGFGDYHTGINPDYLLKEDLENLNVLGSTAEPLLSTALGIISANGKLMKQNPARTEKEFKDIKSISPLGTEMYK
jgi:carboxyl-terminal processing protease